MGVVRTSPTVRRRRLALVIPNFGVGGLERGTVSLARAASTQGIDVVVITLTKPRLERSRTLLDELEALGVAVMDVDLPSASTFRHPARLARAVLRFRAAFKAQRVTHVSSAILDADLPARFAARLLGLPHTCHLVNTTYTEPARIATRSRKVTFAYARVLESVTSSLTRRYIALTEAVADYARNDLGIPGRKLVVIGRGVNTEVFRPSADRRPHPPCDFVSIGRLVPQKDHACTIRGVQKSVPLGVRLRIFGEGPMQSELEVLAREADGGAIRLCAPTGDVPAVLRNADVYVSSAAWEGQSNALLEAMASGCLLVLSDLPVFREVAGDCAFFFAPGDSGQLATCVSKMLNEDEALLQARREGARHRAQERFSEPKLAMAAVNVMVDGEVPS